MHSVQESGFSEHLEHLESQGRHYRIIWFKKYPSGQVVSHFPKIKKVEFLHEVHEFGVESVQVRHVVSHKEHLLSKGSPKDPAGQVLTQEFCEKKYPFWQL